MRIKTKIETLEKRLNIDHQTHHIFIGRKQDWNTLTEEERQKLPESIKDWLTVQETIKSCQGKACMIIGYSPQAEISRRKELGIW